MAEFKDFFTRIITVLDQTQVKYVIVGGIALIIFGRARTTTDLDLIIENDEPKYWQLLQGLSQVDFEIMQEQARMALKEGSNLSIFDNRSFMRIDLKLAKSHDELGALNSAMNVNYHNLTLKVASLEQVLYGKIRYLGNLGGIPEEELLEYNDVLDFVVIYNLKKDDIDLEGLRRKVEAAGLLDTLTRVLKLATRIERP